MINCKSIEDRNSVADAVITVAQPDGSYIVYQKGDKLPPELLAVINPVSETDGN